MRNSWFLFIMMVIVLSSSSSCSKFLNGMHQDSNEESDSAMDSSNDAFSSRFANSEKNDPSQDKANYQNNQNVQRMGGLSADRSGSFEKEDPSRFTSTTLPNVRPDNKRLYRNGSRPATRDDFVDQSQDEGSLWASSGQTNYYFTKNKVRGPGDLLTINLEKELYREVGSEIKRTLNPREKANEIGILQDQYRMRFFSEMARRDSLKTSAASPDKAASPAVQINPTPTPTATSGSVSNTTEVMLPNKKFTLMDVDIYSTLELKEGDTMVGEVLERYPNGNYKIRGMKKIPYKRGLARMVSVVGVVKGTDINDETDTVASGKMYEYRIEIAH